MMSDADLITGKKAAFSPSSSSAIRTTPPPCPICPPGLFCDQDPRRRQGGPLIAGSATSALTVDEGQAAVITLAANEPVTWSISGGDDAARFSIDPATGATSFLAAADYEQPGDADGDNSCDVIVAATDATGNITTLPVTIRVTDPDEAAPVIGRVDGAGEANVRVTVEEGRTEVATLTASEAVNSSVIGELDAKSLVVDPATGVIRFVTVRDPAAPTDSDANNEYILVVSATDENGNVASQTLTVVVMAPGGGAPVITGPSGDGGALTSEVTVQEGVTVIATFAANEAVIWSLAGGTDAARFTIDPETGAISFAAAPDFENPTDSGRDNSYVVRVRALDETGIESFHTLTVSVANTDEIAAKLAEIGDQLRTGLRSYALHSLGGMLSFNEGLMLAAGPDQCGDVQSKALPGALNATETNQDAQLNWSRALNECGRRFNVFFDAGFATSRMDGDWTTRGLASVRVEHRLTQDLTFGLVLMGSMADDRLPGFEASGISDKTLQVNGYPGRVCRRSCGQVPSPVPAGRGTISTLRTTRSS